MSTKDEARPVQGVVSPEEIERVKRMSEVSDALDEYAAAIKAWGVTDDTPHRVMNAENEVIKAIIGAASRVE